MLLRQVIGNVFRRLRRERGITLRELAELAQVSVPYLSEIEKGKKRASTEALLPVAQALGLRQSELLERAERLLERGLVRNATAVSRRRLPTPGRRALARVYPLQPAPPDSSPEGMPELVSRARQLSADDFNRVLDFARRLSR